MTITLYGIPNCDTVKKARTWLADQRHDFAFHDFKKQGLERATVARLAEASSTGKRWSTARAPPGASCDEAKAAVVDKDSALDADAGATLRHQAPGAGRRRSRCRSALRPSATPACSAPGGRHDTASRTLALADELIALASVTPDDAGCQERLIELLEPLGFTFETIVSNGVTNLWARRGTAAPLFVFAGHTDVVPTGPLEQWASEPFVPDAARRQAVWARRGRHEDLDRRHGDGLRGIRRRASRSPRLDRLSDHQRRGRPGRRRHRRRLRRRWKNAARRIDYCMVGEPTADARLGDTIKNGRRGSLSGHLTVKGVQGHIAYPQLARNPIHLAAPALAELVAEQWDAGNEYFPPTSFQISNIHAGTGANNVIPGALELDFNFRFSTASTADGLQRACTPSSTRTAWTTS